MEGIVGEIIKFEYRQRIEYDLELTEESKIALSCMSNINLLNLIIDDSEIRFEVVDNNSNNNYKLYNTLKTFEVGVHTIIAEFDTDEDFEIDMELDEHTLIEDLEDKFKFNIVRSTVGCNVKVM